MVTSRRLPVAVLAATSVLGLSTGVTAVVVARDAPPAAVGSEVPRAEPEGVRLLRAWDAKRSRAYATGDDAALADLYVRGSDTGRADRAVLRGYRQRGLVVKRMRTQLLRATVVRESELRVVLLVTDVLTDAVAVDGAERWPLPRDQPSTRRVVLVAPHDVWLVEEAYAVE